MNWEAAGAIGEIVGAAAVVLTLAYLALQIRQSNKAARIAARLETTRQYADFLDGLFTDPNLARVFREGGEGQALNEIDDDISNGSADHDDLDPGTVDLRSLILLKNLLPDIGGPLTGCALSPLGPGSKIRPVSDQRLVECCLISTHRMRRAKEMPARLDFGKGIESNF